MNHKHKLRQSIRARLEFIEFRLYWDGVLQRQDLVDEFEISIPQASADIALYRESAPGNIQYDTSRKRYLATDQFQPKYSSPSSEVYLGQLRLLAENALVEQDHWLGFVPPFEVAPLVSRTLDAAKVRDVVGAIRERKALLINYQSLSGPDPKERWITPHAIVFDGHRWHTRAWCHSRRAFCDFVIARMLDVRKSKSDIVDPLADVEWYTFVTLRIGPHPGLNENHRKVIELDFGMTNGAVEITTRVALAFYLERRLYLDLPPDTINGERQQIALLNKDEVVRISSEARKRAGAFATPGIE